MPDIEVILDRKRYEEFVLENIETTSLYYTPWWLDAMVGQANWSPYVITSSTTEAIIPLFEPVPNWIIAPPYCQSGGIAYCSSLCGDNRNNRKALVRRRQLLESFLESYSDKRFFKLPFSTDFSDWLPFYWRGYSSSVRYTYQLSLCGEKELLSRESSHIRQKVAIAIKRGWSYSEEVAPQDFFELLKVLYEKRKIATNLIPSLERGVSQALLLQKGFVAGVTSAEGQLLATAFIVYSGGVGYLIATATHTCVVDSAPTAYLLHRVLLSLYAQGFTTFDFEGSMLKGVEFLFRSFSPQQVPLIEISKGKMSIAQRIRLRCYYSKANS